ncbi:zinc finger CCCH domain-containing protein 13-like [Iris pallida]|uniref:Zinc finger CCCH domain-containing protein 13-like n=1 Tax=Iris pallida TaxID=29817 RepID=A0AAX6GIF6_IRIPA|nr:zinc finger CCCH domain-containing protein 13-like [Iris pallida]
MARGSRHKSHRSRKHRDRSDSEEEARVSTASEPTEKRRSSSNGEFSGESGKKRKDRTEDTVAVAPDRWNGGGGGEEDGRVEKEPKKDLQEAADAEKKAKPKASSSDSKGKHRGSSERNKEKRMSEESSRRGSSGGQYKDGKEREREREGALEKDKKVQESRNERSDDVGSRKEEQVVKKDVASSELQEEMLNPELEKELEKRMKRRRDGSGDNDNFHSDCKESEAKHVLSSKDEHSKNGSYKDERYKDGRYREKYRDDLERVKRLRDDKRRDEYTSRIHATDQSDNKHSRDENRLSEGRYKTKIQNSDHDDSHVDDRGTKLKDNRGRKRSSDEIEDSSDVKPQTMKESWEDTERNGSRSNKLDFHSDRRREHPHLDKVDSGLNSSCPKSSPGPSAYSVKDQTRHSSRQTESSQREPLPEEACRPRTTSRADYHGTSGGRDRVPESRSMEKTKLKDDIRSDVLSSEAAASHYDKILRSDIRCSSNQLTEKSPTSTRDRRSERSSARRSLDVEELGQRSSSYKDGRDSSYSKHIDREREFPKDKLNVSGSSQVDFLNNQSTSHGPSSYNRTGNIQGTPPGHLSTPPVRLGVDSPSVLGSYEDENRIQCVDHKPNSLYTRSSDVGGTAWKNSPTWSPAANGFMPLQHGPPGFHPAVQQYPAPPIYGIRPSMDLNHTGVSYHPHEASRFSSHARPYGWHNSLDDCPPQLQLWDGSNNMIGDESHMYGRLDWDQNRHLMGNRGWEMNVDMWNRQNGNTNTEFPVPRKEQEYSTQALADETWAGHCSRDERAGTELPMDASGINRSSDTSPAKNTFGTPRKALCEKIYEPSKMLSMRGISEKRSDSYARFCCNYLKKLDISPGLVQPELYEQCMSSLGTKNGILASNVSMQINKSQDARVAAKSKTYFLNSRSSSGIDAVFQINKSQDARVAAKSKTYFLNSRSSSGIDAVFQRAMSLYKKQRDATKEATNTGLRLESFQEDKVPSASDGAEVNVNSPNDVEEDLPMGGVAPAFLREVEEKTSTDAKGNRPEDEEERHDCPTDTEEKCDNISESVVLADGPEDHEALIPECMVNVSRIHHSLESTH